MGTLPRPGQDAACPTDAPALGYGMGVTFYSWSSDQLAHGTKFVPVTVRDSTYVLDEICNNETELPIREHTTDTAGATRSSLLFDLLGFRFAPGCAISVTAVSLRQALSTCSAIPASSHMSGRINRPRILDWWDAMLRVAGSMKLGWVTASLLVQKLQAHPHKTPRRALQEYGRLGVPCTSCTGTPTRRIGAVSCASSTKGRRYMICVPP